MNKQLKKHHLKKLLCNELNEILMGEFITLDILPGIEDKISNIKVKQNISTYKQMIISRSISLVEIVQKIGAEMEIVKSKEFDMKIARLIYSSVSSSNPEIIDVNIACGIEQINRFQSASFNVSSIYAKTLGYDQIAINLYQLGCEWNNRKKIITKSS